MVNKPAENGLQKTREQAIDEEFDMEDVEVTVTDAEISSNKVSRDKNGSENIRNDAEEIVQGLLSNTTPERVINVNAHSKTL